MKRTDLTENEKNRLFAEALREMLQAGKDHPGKMIPFSKAFAREKEALAED